MPGADGAGIGGVVLAAGTSSRMGRNKLLIELDGEALVRRAAKNAAAAGLDPVIVVLGFESDRIRGALDGIECETATNADYRGPMSRSFHEGLRALGREVGAAIVILPDMVRVTRDMIAAVRAEGLATASAPLVVSRYGDVTAPPILFRRALFDELLAWEGEGCGKPVVRAHAAEARYLDWPAERLGDLDTPEDLAGLARA